jgi:hypothetical protein
LRSLLVTSLQHRGAAALVLATTAGCAERGLASGPASSPGTSTWLIVALAATLPALLLAALVMLPRRPSGGSPLTVAVLAAQAGAALVGVAVLLGAALQSRRLVARPAGAEEANSLLGLSGLDGGDVEFFTLMAAVIGVLGALVVVVLVVAARCADDPDPVNRALASAVLVVEAGGGAVALVLVVLGSRGLPFIVPAAALPLAVLAAISGWPRASAPDAPMAGIGYNERHG